jgi:hypothetical protein
MPCIYTVVPKVARYETQASFKGRLVTHIVRVMSVLPVCSENLIRID